MNFKPIFDRIVVEPTRENEQEKSCLVLPNTLERKPQMGVVVAIGDGENFDNQKTEMKVKIGNKILFEKHAGNELKIDNKTYIVLRQIDVIGVFDD